MRRLFSHAIASLHQLAGNGPKHPASSAYTLFVAAFFYFLCSQIITNSTFVYHVGFYGLLLPSFLYLVAKDARAVLSIPDSFGLLGLGAFFAYAISHAALGQFADQSLIKILRDTVLNAAFLFMALAVFSNTRMNSLMLMRSLVITTVVMIPIGYAMYVYDPSQTENFLPIGRANNPIPIGNIYAFAALIALWLFLQPSSTQRTKMLCLLCYGLVVVAIILTSQRGPLLSLFAATGLACLLYMRRRYLVLGFLFVLAILTDFFMFHNAGNNILYLDRVYNAILHFFTQRDSARLTIWQQAFQRITEHPWQGYGLHAKFTVEGIPGAVNPHNLFISTAYYLGMVGLLLLLLPLLTAFAVSFNQRRDAYHQLCLILLLHAVVAVMTNYGQVIKAPAPLWTIYWLPIAMALARAKAPHLRA